MKDVSDKHWNNTAKELILYRAFAKISRYAMLNMTEAERYYVVMDAVRNYFQETMPHEGEI